MSQEKSISKKAIALVVQRYGIEVNGGAELEARLYAEHLSEAYEVTVLTTCALDYTTWENYYPEGLTVINNVKVLRFKVDSPRNYRRFDEVHSRILNQMGASGAASLLQEDQLEWMREQGPISEKLMGYIKINKASFHAFLFMTYLYYSTFEAIKEVYDKSILIPTAHDEPMIYFPIFKETFTSPKAIFYNTKAEKIFVENLFANQSIPNEVGGVGITLPVTQNQGDTAEYLRQEYKLDKPYIVYIGRIDESKGCKELFKMWDGFCLQRSQKGQEAIDLVLVGKEILPVPARSYIKSLGFISEEDKYKVLKNARLLVLPSLYESLSMVVLEAFALEKPVLVNGHCTVLKNHCQSSNGGLYYYNYLEFEKALDFLLSSPTITLTLGKNGLAYQKEYYVWEKIMQKLQQLIEIIC